MKIKISNHQKPTERSKMIFELHYFLIMAGFSAVGILFGSYLRRYGGATEFDLGLVFTISPIAIIFRPIICAKADRYQSHKQLLMSCIFGTTLAYLPLVIMPFLVDHPNFSYLLTKRNCFWVSVISHLIGSICFCGVRSLGDALIVNYAKRIGSDFTAYRKYGAISFGGCGFLMGLINQNWILPDFVPTMLLLVCSFGLLGMLVYLWPDEHFIMINKNSEDEFRPLPTPKQIAAHMTSKFIRTVFFFLPASHRPKGEITVTSSSICRGDFASRLSSLQQVRIFLLISKRDIRLPLYLMMLFYAGLVGYAPQNFVYVYMQEICETGKCNAGSLAGLVMISFCLSEVGCYFVLSHWRETVDRFWLLEASFVSLTIHYYFYGLVLPHVSPYFFLVEALHGIEYSVAISTSVELGYRFASEVELLLPELAERGIIDKYQDPNLVKLSLMATMSACFTLVYDGPGSMFGSVLYGSIADYYSFPITWCTVGTLATVGFFAAIAVLSIGRCFAIRPKILELQVGPCQRNA